MTHLYLSIVEGEDEFVCEPACLHVVPLTIIDKPTVQRDCLLRVDVVDDAIHHLQHTSHRSHMTPSTTYESQVTHVIIYNTRVTGHTCHHLQHMSHRLHVSPYTTHKSQSCHHLQHTSHRLHVSPPTTHESQVTRPHLQHELQVTRFLV